MTHLPDWEEQDELEDNDDEIYGCGNSYCDFCGDGWDSEWEPVEEDED